VHVHLLLKLDHNGIRGALLSWLKYFLTDRSQYVTLHSQRSYPTTEVSGIPQGTVLVLLIFLLNINDFPSRIRSKVKLYADDVLFYSYINSKADCQILQEDLDALVQWAHTWQMEFNCQIFKSN